MYCRLLGVHALTDTMIQYQQAEGVEMRLSIYNTQNQNSFLGIIICRGEQEKKKVICLKKHRKNSR